MEKRARFLWMSELQPWFSQSFTALWPSHFAGKVGLTRANKSLGTRPISRREILERSFLAFVCESAKALSCALMFSVGNTERWSVNHGQAQRSGYLGYGDFLAVEEKIPVQKSARLEVSPG